ncbi:MAG: hypothetical protein KDC38_11200, partial [Planctomycetes bacterium]|nr:hypothetical protein [Planctomycetota bacterium]
PSSSLRRDDGMTWTRCASPSIPAGGGSGVFSVIAVDNPGHAGGVEIRVYYQTGGGALRVIRSDSTAVGFDKYIDFDLGSDQEILPATAAGDASGFTPTGRVAPLPSGEYGLFFVPQTDSYVGFAESADGLTGWSVTRDAGDPLLSTSANALAPDPARPEIKELAVVDAPGGWTVYFDGAIPGGSSFNRAVGRLFVGSPVEFVRGDCNGDGVDDIADAVCALGYLFLGAAASCLDALDSNDSGILDIADPVYLLEALFVSGPLPPAPFPSCGTDPTGDLLDCVLGAMVCP